MPRRRLLLVPAVLAALAPAAAHAAHPAPADVLASGPGQAQCLAATADGGIVVFRRGGLRATGLTADGTAPTSRIGDADLCAAVGSAGDGAALAAASVVRAADDAQLLLADRPVGGPFSPLRPQSTTTVAAADDTTDAVALGGGQALVSAFVDGEPGVARRDASGAVTTLALPSQVATAALGPVGPAVGLDALGRGLVAYVPAAPAARAPAARDAARASAARATRHAARASAARATRHAARAPAARATRRHGHAADGGLVVATVAPDGTVGAPVRIGDAPADFGALRLVVGTDGAASVGWSRGGEAFVAQGTTTAGIDPATVRSGSVRGNVAMAVDPAGNAVAVGTRDLSGTRGEAVVTSAAAGGAFTAPRRYRLEQGQDTPPSAALGASGQAAVVLPRSVGVGSTLDDVRLVAGRAGAVGGPARRVPLAGAHVLELQAVVDPAGRPTVLADLERYVGDPRRGTARQRSAIVASRLRAGAARTARGRVRIARSQVIGRRRQALRARVTCPRACAVRVTGRTSDDRGQFDASVTLDAGRHTLRVPYDNGGGSAGFRPLRAPAVARLGVAVDDARGERRSTVRVRIRP